MVVAVSVVDRMGPESGSLGAIAGPVVCCCVLFSLYVDVILSGVKKKKRG